VEKVAFILIAVGNIVPVRGLKPHKAMPESTLFFNNRIPAIWKELLVLQNVEMD
jgi:hypothetical protein